MFKVNKKYIPLVAMAVSKFALAADVSTNGGLKVKSGDYSFNVGGIVKMDQRQFMGSKGTDFRSGANLRDLGLDVGGSIGKNLGYEIGLSFDPVASSVSVEHAFLNHTGLLEKSSFMVGQVYMGFSLENSTSSKWIPMLERSMGSKAFSPSPGLGIGANKYDKNYSVTLVVTQPKLDNGPTDASGNTIRRTDHWQSSIRATHAWHFSDAKIFQIGVSGHIQDDSGATVNFKTVPEANARVSTKILDTGRINASNHKTGDIELSFQQGPLYAEAEYQAATVKRSKNANGERPSKVNFNGYHAQVAYVLTGEHRKFNEYNGTFGQVVPSSDKGAWEIAARHTYLNLNYKDQIFGGAGHTTGVGVNYYYNANIRVSAEYNHAVLHPGSASSASNLKDRDLDTIGLRLQLVF